MKTMILTTVVALGLSVGAAYAEGRPQVIKVRRTMASKVLPSMARKVRPEAERAGTHYEAGEAFSGLFAASDALAACAFMARCAVCEAITAIRAAATAVTRGESRGEPSRPAENSSVLLISVVV